MDSMDPAHLCHIGVHDRTYYGDPMHTQIDTYKYTYIYTRYAIPVNNRGPGSALTLKPTQFPNLQQGTELGSEFEQCSPHLCQTFLPLYPLHSNSHNLHLFLCIHKATIPVHRKQITIIKKNGKYNDSNHEAKYFLI